MTYRTVICAFVLTSALSLPGFPQAKPASPPAPAAAPEEPPPPLAVPKDYHYNARGRRDPFLNPVPPKPVAKPAGPPPPPAVAARPKGLKGVLVAEIEIIGIVASRDPSMDVVTIQAPGGVKYFARVGDALYDAVIKSIKPDSVTFAVTAPGLDPSAPKEIVRKMRGDDK